MRLGFGLARFAKEEDKNMRSFINVVAMAVLTCAAPVAAWAQTAVRVEATGRFDPDLVRTLQQLTETALRERGVTDGAFVLRVGRLGNRIPMSLEVLAGDGSASRVASLAATGIEEADVVVSRLADSVVLRKSVASTARIRTVVEVETEEPKKLPSERHWTIGAPAFPGGFYSAYTRETANWRVDLTLQGTGKWGESGSGAGFFGVGGAYLFSDGPSSPFIGGGAGMVWVDDKEGTGAHLEAGMELLRLHRMRFIIAADVIIPAFDPREDNRFKDAKRVYPSIQLRLGF